MKYFLTIFIIIFFCILKSFSTPIIKIDPINHNFGKVKEGKVVKGSFNITNTGDEILTVKIGTSCGCFVPLKTDIELKPGDTVNVPYSFRTKGYGGEVSKNIIIKSNASNNPSLYFILSGIVERKFWIRLLPIPQRTTNLVLFNNIITITEFDKNDITNDELNIYYFADENCNKCRKLMTKIRKWATLNLDEEENYIYYYQLANPENDINIKAIIDTFGFIPKTPILIYDGKIYDGKENIESFLKNIKINPVNKKTRILQLTIPSIILFGLADGINPCAFTVMILLISYLMLRLKNNRKQIMAVGLIYIIAVYLTYFAIGLGFFKILRLLYIYRIISIFLKYGLSLILLILALISLYDFIVTVKGKKDSIILKLPQFIQKSIRKNIRNKVKSYEIFTGAIILGFVISLFELVCTGQVYFPIISLMVRTPGEKLTGIFLLILYNLAFIAPLVLVFLCVYKGMSVKVIGDFFSRHVYLVKFLFFILFVLFSIINLFA